MLELVLPRRCGGCGAPGEHLCAKCRRVLAHPPYRMSPPTHPHVPVYTFGPYADARRGVVLAMKERGNLALRSHVGAVLAAGLEHLEVRGEIPHRVVLVPAPTRAASARSRGGDPVEAVCLASGHPVWPGLRLAPRTADQSTLTAEERRANLAGSVLITSEKVPDGPLVVVDDVVTTGATLQVSVEKLLAFGGDVVACVALCAA